MAMNCFSGTEDMRKAIILITDSEDHEGEAVEAARLAAENGIQVMCSAWELPQEQQCQASPTRTDNPCTRL